MMLDNRTRNLWKKASADKVLHFGRRETITLFCGLIIYGFGICNTALIANKRTRMGKVIVGERWIVWIDGGCLYLIS
jgi:hypothetical protein